MQSSVLAPLAALFCLFLASCAVDSNHSKSKSSSSEAPTELLESFKDSTEDFDIGAERYLAIELEVDSSHEGFLAIENPATGAFIRNTNGDIIVQAVSPKSTFNIQFEVPEEALGEPLIVKVFQDSTFSIQHRLLSDRSAAFWIPALNLEEESQVNIFTELTALNSLVALKLEQEPGKAEQEYQQDIAAQVGLSHTEMTSKAASDKRAKINYALNLFEDLLEESSNQNIAGESLFLPLLKNNDPFISFNENNQQLDLQEEILLSTDSLSYLADTPSNVVREFLEESLSVIEQLTEYVSDNPPSSNHITKTLDQGREHLVKAAEIIQELSHPSEELDNTTLAVISEGLLLSVKQQIQEPQLPTTTSDKETPLPSTEAQSLEFLVEQISLTLEDPESPLSVAVQSSISSENSLESQFILTQHLRALTEPNLLKRLVIRLSNYVLTPYFVSSFLEEFHTYRLSNHINDETYFELIELLLDALQDSIVIAFDNDMPTLDDVENEVLQKNQVMLNVGRTLRVFIQDVLNLSLQYLYDKQKNLLFEFIESPKLSEVVPRLGSMLEIIKTSFLANPVDPPQETIESLSAEAKEKLQELINGKITICSIDLSELEGPRGDTCFSSMDRFMSTLETLLRKVVEDHTGTTLKL